MDLRSQLPHLVRLLDDDSPIVREHVLHAMVGIGPEIRQALNELETILTDEQLKELYALLFEQLEKNDLHQDYSEFSPGQLVKHIRYGYRGVIASHDLYCMADEDWYLSNKTQPNRDQPWYHVLVDGTSQVTYAAQDSLIVETEDGMVDHPYIQYFFNGFEDGAYLRNTRPWPRT